jgi:hypothetical protein
VLYPSRGNKTDTPRGLKPHGFSGKPSYLLIFQKSGFAPEGDAPAWLDRCMHRQASNDALTATLTLAQADGTRSKTRVLFLKGGTYLETGKHDSVGEGAPCPRQMFSHKRAELALRGYFWLKPPHA